MSRGLAHLIVNMSHSFVDSMSGLECIRVILYQLYYTYGSTYSRNGSNVPYMQYIMFTFIKLQ